MELLNRDEFITTLRLLGVTSIEIEFDGSGDDGQIESVTVTPNTVDTSTPITLRFEETRKHQNQILPMKAALKELGYALLEDCPYDWVNNDGGFGQIVIDLTEDPVRFLLNMNVRELISHEYHEEY